MTTFSISPSVSHNVTKKETKFLKRVTTYEMFEARTTPNDYNYVQLIYKDSQGQGLFEASNDSRFIGSTLFWGIIGDEFNDLQ